MLRNVNLTLSVIKSHWQESKHEVMLSDLCLRKFTPAVENVCGERAGGLEILCSETARAERAWTISTWSPEKRQRCGGEGQCREGFVRTWRLRMLGAKRVRSVRCPWHI